VNKPREYPVTNGDLHIHAVAEGPRGATPLVLVHGYPDNHRVWDRVAADLSRDFLVIRYDVRGAGRSGKPRRTREYRLALLAQDLRAVVDTLIPGRPFHLVAHDWGAIQSWESATAPELASRLRSYTAISGPCLDHVGYWLRERLGGAPGQGGTAQLLRQLGRSWYVLLFQLPLLPELIWLAGLDRLWPAYLRRHEGIADAHYRTSQKADGRFGVKLYRANVLPRLLRPRPRRANCPVQVIVPTQDAYVSPPLTDSLVRWTGKLTRQELDAPHWAPLTHPEAVCRSVRAFVAAHP
jgi:pimeloyl-ACP methyl ester carboxylesterase